MTGKNLQRNPQDAINEAGRNGAGNTETALTEKRTIGGSANDG